MMLVGPAAQAESLRAITKSGLKFIAREQVAKTGPLYEVGEWPTSVRSSAIPVLVGVGRLFVDEEEPSAFTTGSVVNQLSNLYQRFPEYTEIPSMIRKAQPSFERYREGSLYNFYPPKMWNGTRVHQAADMTLLPMWKGFTNIPQDADTSSVTWMARSYGAMLSGKNLDLPSGTLRSLERFRDENRQAHFYNRQHGERETGAFLTWQYDENDPAMPRFYFADPEDGSRIPFNRNDVDCVVNINVLRMLALTGNSNIEGRKQSCEYLQRVAEERRYASCGIYYPNTYNFAYSAALMDMAGETCLRPQATNMVRFILGTKITEGGWVNRDNQSSDRVQSTAFAMIALSRFGNFKDKRTREAMISGANLLMKRKLVSEQGDIYWKGEVFFTDTAIARSLINWRSNSFTTAVALTALLEANKRTGWTP